VSGVHDAEGQIVTGPGARWFTIGTMLLGYGF